MKVVIVAGMIERKLFSKIQPIIEQDIVEQAYLVRNEEFQHEKVICCSPKGFFAKNKALAELWRVWKIVHLVLTNRADVLIGIGHVPHGFFVCAIGRLFRKKVILLLMGKNDLYHTYPNDRFRQWAALKVAKWATIIGTRGTNSQKWLIGQGISPNRVFIPHNVFDFNDFAPAPTPKKYDMVYVGLISFYKG
ncbi:MAG: hypothetical protein HC896_11530 [Bacteroidales bacterium]|nr:hypothetical protein [Bacteroidales bacterium]